MNHHHLAETVYYNFSHSTIQKLVAPFLSNEFSNKEKATKLYLLVRDDWKYNAYNMSFKSEAFKASTIAQKDSGHCIDKAILLITCLRAVGISATLQLAKVKNHIAVERLMEKLGTNELSPHGLVNILIDGRWFKASPAFNKSLCEKYEVAPLDFNGEEDSIFQEYNKNGQKFMEYLEDYGSFDDVPVDFIRNNIISNYPRIVEFMNANGEVQFTQK